MLAAILVGGKGTRLQSLISALPKPLAPIGDKPFLELLIRKLTSHGITQIVLLTGYMHEQIESMIGDGHQFGVSLQYSRETAPLGTAGALLHAAPYLQTSSDFLLINGDTYFSGNLDSLIQAPIESNMAIMGVMKVAHAARYGSIDLKEGTAEIQSFQEKQQASEGLVSAGICKLSSRIFADMRDYQFDSGSLEKDVFPYLLQRGETMQAVLLDGAFYDIGTPESYTDFCEMARSSFCFDEEHETTKQ